MSFNHRMLITSAVAFAGTVGATAPALAQRGVPPRPGTGTPPNKRAMPADTIKKPTAGVALDFQDQELKVVLDALAAAGELNVSFSNIPPTRVTVHMGRPVNRDGMIEMLKNVAESNGLKFTQTPTLIQISGTPVETPATRVTLAQQAALQQAQQQFQAQQMRLYTYRLRHASAVQLAPVLTNLFSGFSGNGGFRTTNGTTILPNPNGGFQVIGGQPPGNVRTIPGGVPDAATLGNNGRGAGRGAQNNNPNAGAAIASALTSVFQATNGSLSSQAGDIRIIAEETSNSLLIRATESDWALVEQIIQGVDLRPLQVLIEVTIAEVQRTHDLDLGVSGTVRSTRGNATDSTFAPSGASARDFILALTGGHGTIKYDVAIAALQERGDVRVLSLPVIIAQNNRQATLNVGSSRPFIQVSQSSVDIASQIQTVQYIDVGTVLTITPTINPDGYVNLQVTQTDNSAANEVQFNAPIINKREATTQIFIRDGQTTVIGGLADNTHSSDVSGIPLLSRIPLVGSLLFGRTTKSEATNELFLFLTPHIITSDDDIDKLRDAVKQNSDLLKEIDVGPRIVLPADTLKVKPDSVKKDSLTTLRRRPPATDSSARDSSASAPWR
jgi:type II secretory pathway component GspD/PulD (secretin)